MESTDPQSTHVELSDTLNDDDAAKQLTRQGFCLTIHYMIERRGWLCSAFRESDGIGCDQFVSVDEITSLRVPEQAVPWNMILNSLNTYLQEREV